MKSLMLFAALGLVVCMPLVGGAGGDKDKDSAGKPKYDNRTYVPTADEVILKMFEMGKINKNDVIFDLGCGDGRILYMAAKKFGTRCVGLETNPDRITEAMEQARKYDVGTLVKKAQLARRIDDHALKIAPLTPH